MGYRRATLTTNPVLAKRNLLLGAAIERQPLALFIVRFEGDDVFAPPVVYANPAFYELTGYTDVERAGGLYPRIFGPDTDRAAVARAAERVMRGEDVVVPEIVLYRRNGEAFWARVHSHPIDFDVPHAALILEDITAHRARDRTIALLDEAVEQALDFVIVTDSRTHAEGGPHFVYGNRAFFEAMGYERDELIGKSYSMIYSPNNDPAAMEALRANIDAGKPNYREVILRRKDGTDFWIEFVAKPFESMGDRYRLSIGRDITLRKRAFNQISLLVATLEQSPHRIVLYEPDLSGELALSYENEPAAKAGFYRALRLWNSETEQGHSFRERLLSGEAIQHVYSEKIDGAPALVELSVRGVRNGPEIGAFLSIERVLAQASSDGHVYQSKLILISRLLPAITEAHTTSERLVVLRALLLDTFEAEVREIGPATGGSLHIAPGSNAAYFSFGEHAYVAEWPRPLETASLTALRFCIEATLEEDRLAR